MSAGPLPTANGHNFGEAASALQKAIRRSDERESLYWAVELDVSGYGNYLWKRLRVICSEDVGLAWPEGPSVIRSLYESWREARASMKGRQWKAGTGDRLFLAHAVMLLARAPKSRIIDHALLLAYNDPEVREVPDYALDKHTRRGKGMKRGWEHFFDEGAKLVGEPDDLPDEYRDEARELLSSGKLGGRATRLQPDEGGAGDDLFSLDD